MARKHSFDSNERQEPASVSENVEVNETATETKETAVEVKEEVKEDVVQDAFDFNKMSDDEIMAWMKERKRKQAEKVDFKPVSVPMYKLVKTSVTIPETSPVEMEMMGKLRRMQHRLDNLENK